MLTKRPPRGHLSSSQGLHALGFLTLAAHANALQSPPHAPPESILLDEWLDVAEGTAGQPLRALATAITLHHMPKVRADASNRRTEIITTIIANFFAYPHRAIALPLRRDKATRYDRAVITGRQLKPTIDQLEAAQLIVRTPAIFKVKRTTIAPTAMLLKLIANHKVTTQCTSRLPDEEVIILKRRDVRKAVTEVEAQSNRNDEVDHQFIASPNDSTAALIDYPNDCQEASALRNQLRDYNRFISKQYIRIVGNAINPPPAFKPFKRIFASHGPVQFNSHGRLYAGCVGGWHQGLPKEDRKNIRINGEGVIDLDFANMHLRLAYCEARCTPPDGDLYAIKGLEAYRPAVKVCVSAMLSRIGDLKKLPPKARELLPKQWTGERIAKAILEHHAPIAQLFGQDRGMRYMWQDSEILMEVLTRLMRKGNAALPMHDGIMVQESARGLAKNLMQEVSHDLLGVALPVEVKTHPV